MDVPDIVAFGERLSSALLRAAEDYHVKSDQHDILLYEAATVSAHVAWLAPGVPVPTHLGETALLGEWGRGFSWGEESLLERAAVFYRELRARGVETG